MAKVKSFPGKDNVFMRKVGLLLFVLLGFSAKDPFGLSSVEGHGFRPMRNNIESYDQVRENWPEDNSSGLEGGKRVFVDQVFGPESLAFDVHGRGPYTGLADGRVVRWMGDDLGWETFALVTRNWSEKMCANGVDSTTSKQWEVEWLCGRPLGLRFDEKSGYLYIADAYYGLMVVGPEGGYANSLAAQVAGKRMLFTNDLDIHNNGSIFFTDSSLFYNRANNFLIHLVGDASGRLLRYDPPTRTTHVVLDGLAFANGVQLSINQSFIYFTETSACRLMKYWLEGPKNGRTEVVANLAGYPDNVRLNEQGELWVAIDCCRTNVQQALTNNPWMRSIYFKLPLPMRYLPTWVTIKSFSMIAKFNEQGEILDVLEDKNGVVMELVSEVREVEGKLWLGTVADNYIATYDLYS